MLSSLENSLTRNEPRDMRLGTMGFQMRSRSRLRMLWNSFLRAFIRSLMEKKSLCCNTRDGSRSRLLFRSLFNPPSGLVVVDLLCVSFSLDSVSFPRSSRSADATLSTEL